MGKESRPRLKSEEERRAGGHEVDCLKKETTAAELGQGNGPRRTETVVAAAIGGLSGPLLGVFTASPL